MHDILDVRSFRRKAAVALALALALSACGGLNPPPQLSPVGDLYFQAKQVALALDSLTNVTIAAEAQGLLSRKDAYTVTDTTKKALVAADSLVRAVHAGAEQNTARARAVAVISDLMNSIPPQLSPHARQVTAPYIATIRTLLAAFA